MPNWKLEIQVLPPFRRRITNRWLHSAVQHTLDNEETEHVGLIGLTIADDNMLRQLNRDYAGIDEITDVLAFGDNYCQAETALSKLENESVDFIIPFGAPAILGDVVISYPQAARQAREQKHTIREEITLLVAHGVLHLLGYDHVIAKQKKDMWERQDRVVGQMRQWEQQRTQKTLQQIRHEMVKELGLEKLRGLGYEFDPQTFVRGEL